MPESSVGEVVAVAGAVISQRDSVPRDFTLGAARIRADGLAREESVSDRDRSDAALIRAARDGSEAALEALFRRHWPTAHRAAYLVCHDRDGAEDIAQEAFLSAVRSLGRFDRRRPFAPWLHRIVVNRAIDWTRMRASRHETTTATVPEGPAQPEPESQELDDLLMALAELEPAHRAVIVMRYVQDLSPGEIAGALGIPRGTVNSRLRRGLDKLGGQLERERVR
jgi:RNA polymerase sigma-70 factor, ECF subfamily